MKPPFKKSWMVILTSLALTFSAIGVTPAYAATFTVNNPSDVVDDNIGNGVCHTAGGVCTLRAAIQEANAWAGDDTITVPAGTYTLTIAGTGENAAATGDLDLTSNITINGAGAGSTFIQAGTLGVGGPPNGIDRVFNVIGGTVNISGVTVRNGNGVVFGGGIYSNTGTLTIITNSIISGNSATNGGGIFSNGSTVTLLNSTLSGNSVSGDIGGIYMNNPGTTPNLTITNSTVTGNIAGGVGAGILNGGTANITNSTIASNLSGSSGGGIYNTAGALTITNSTFSGNSATTSGGASTELEAQ